VLARDEATGRFGHGVDVSGNCARDFHRANRSCDRLGGRTHLGGGYAQRERGRFARRTIARARRSEHRHRLRRMNFDLLETFDVLAIERVAKHPFQPRQVDAFFLGHQGAAARTGVRRSDCLRVIQSGRFTMITCETSGCPVRGGHVGRDRHADCTWPASARCLDIQTVTVICTRPISAKAISSTRRPPDARQASLVTQEERVNLARLERMLGDSLDREHVEGFEKIEIHAPKPVTVFRSSGARNRSTRNRPRSRWA